MFLLMSKTNKKKSESDYKCCKLEIYKLTPSFRNSRLSSSERLCWVVWSITRSSTLNYPYTLFFFILKYLLCHKWRKVPHFLHYYVWHKPSSKWHTDTVFVQIPTFVFCFCLFVCFFDFGQFIYKLWDWKIACAWKKQFHISRKYAFL